jgi:hypothetical protein
MRMDLAKKKGRERTELVVGRAADFLELSTEEARLIERRLVPAPEMREFREKTD